MSISLSQLKPSLTIVYNNQPYIILESEHAKLARGSSFVRAKIKNLITSQTLNCTLRDSDKINPAFIERKKLIFSYQDGQYYHFLDSKSYEDFILHQERIEDKAKYLKENLELSGLFYENKLINLELPASIILKVAKTAPGFRGNTVKSGTKPALLETGLAVDVPLFIKNEDLIKIDTRNQQYLERA
ncbi:MAG: elongation factor P [Candidatus Omnitrophica bacterium]|nr:elongation factor P [Candidatus Omnitrophota bacterium]MCF7877222.1 elongation factor P [Candidatus Omnitrophota bacterium]MCF7878071.1 elongation factor P [Candidatus Omnitrophota bacterium]MCF7892752.1 elongation factor P [Candidatus Omnitrophota bacterium]